MNFNIQTYLETHFTNIKIETPLFYNAPIGIRFELGVPYRGVDDPKYFTTVQLRAKTIFEAIFEEKDRMIVLIRTFKYVEPYSSFIVGDSIFSPKYIKGTADRIQLYDESPIYDEDDGALIGYSQVYDLCCLRSEVNYATIIKAIGNRDFSIPPFIIDDIFFIHPKKHIIFHMYDDRGADVIASEKDHLQSIYQTFNNWILDYDRERIDHIFKR